MKIWRRVVNQFTRPNRADNGNEFANDSRVSRTFIRHFLHPREDRHQLIQAVLGEIGEYMAYVITYGTREQEIGYCGKTGGANMKKGQRYLTRRYYFPVPLELRVRSHKRYEGTLKRMAEKIKKKKNEEVGKFYALPIVMGVHERRALNIEAIMQRHISNSHYDL